MKIRFLLIFSLFSLVFVSIPVYAQSLDSEVQVYFNNELIEVPIPEKLPIETDNCVLSNDILLPNTGIDINHRPAVIGFMVLILSIVLLYKKLKKED